MLARQLNRVRKCLRIAVNTAKEICTSGLQKGKTCPICHKQFRIYWPYGVQMRDNAQCPFCRSMERHRTLWLYLEQNADLLGRDGMRVLHFAPEKAFLDRFSSMSSVDYWPVDLNPNMEGIRRAVDITDIPFEDGSMDVIICNHVMEHIPDEKKAFSELHRVLAKDGIAIINVPMDASRETTFENPEYNTPELREKYFGQHDHVRVYGRDYADRLRAASFEVEIAEPNKERSDAELKAYGVYREDKVYICRKS